MMLHRLLLLEAERVSVVRKLAALFAVLVTALALAFGICKMTGVLQVGSKNGERQKKYLT